MLAKGAINGIKAPKTPPPGWHINLAGYLNIWHEKTNSPAHLNEAIQATRQGIKSARNKQPDTAIALTTLGNLLVCRYRGKKRLASLLRAIRAIATAVTSIQPQDHPQHFPMMLHHFSDSLRHLHEHTNRRAVLELAVQMEMLAVAYSTPGDSNQWLWLYTLGTLLKSRHTSRGHVSDLEGAISALQQAKDCSPNNSLILADMLGKLGSWLNLHYEYTKDAEELEQAVQMGRIAVKLVSRNHASRPTLLGNLSNSLVSRYYLTRNIEDLNDSVSIAREAVVSTPKGHDDEGGLIDCLGHKLEALYKQTANEIYLKDAIRLSRKAVKSKWRNHSHLAGKLDSLATKLHWQHDHTGELRFIKEAIKLSKRAVLKTGGDHPDQAIYLTNLAHHFEGLYNQIGEVALLEKAIKLTRLASSFVPKTHLQYAIILGCLGSKLEQWYEQTGDTRCLEEAIKITDFATKSTPTGSLDQAARLCDLSNQLELRYERTGVLNDLECSIAIARRAIGFTPRGHSELAGRLNNLAVKLHSQYERTELRTTLDEVISTAKCAVKVTSGSRQDTAMYLNTIGTALHDLYRRTRQRVHLNEAIQAERESVDSMPRGHMLRVTYQHNLGLSLETLYYETADEKHLQEAIYLVNMAVELTPPDHLFRASRLNNLWLLLETRYERQKQGKDREATLRIALEAWNSLASRPFDRIRAGSRGLGLLAANLDFDKGIKLGIKVLEYLPLVHTRTLSREDQQFVVSTFAGVASKLAACLLKKDRIPEALKYLEHGRTIIINQLLGDRSNMLELQKSHPELAARYKLLVNEINFGPGRHKDGTRRHFSSRRREAAAELDACLTEIQSIDDYKSFFQEQSIVEMQQTAVDGFIIVVNITEFASDAIIISKSTIARVELPNMSAKEVTNRFDRKWTAPTFKSQLKKNVKFLEALEWLWEAGVKCILDHTSPARGRATVDLPRVWWIGTGLSFSLPFHAAGKHSKGSVENVCSRVVSSYTPSIRALAFARQKVMQTRVPHKANGQLLMVTMPTTPPGTDHEQKASRLPKTMEERDKILRTIGPYLDAIVLEHCSVEQVSEAMKHCSIAHFACHGKSDHLNPSNSALILQRSVGPDKVVEQDPLTVQRVSGLTLERAQIAYLSACSTAANEAHRLADEVIHIASGFQVAGFPHVIGCLWEAADSECVDLAKDFYSFVLQRNQSIITEDVSLALHKAVLKLRESHLKMPLMWGQYVHYGV